MQGYATEILSNKVEVEEDCDSCTI